MSEFDRSEREGVQRDLNALEQLRRFRHAVVEQLCLHSNDQDEEVLSQFRVDAMLPFVEFFFILKAMDIRSEDEIAKLADLHNRYIENIMKDKAKMSRMGVKGDRLLDAIFTSDTLPRLLQNWRDQPGAIDQSNLGRLLAVAMSTETVRKLVVACGRAGYLERSRTPYGTILVQSRGTMERIYGDALRQFRMSIEQP